MAENEATQELKKRRRGRPRKEDADREVRRAEIVNAAVKLFIERSYRDTTMSDIAHSIGLNQSSLYYWFKSKEELLEAILKDNQTSSELSSMLSMLPGEHPLHLYAVVYADTMMMCSFPFDYYELEDAALSHPDRFEAFFETYRNLRKTMGQIISDGIEAGDFPQSVDPALATTVALSLAEGLQHQYHQSATLPDEAVAGIWGGIELQSAQELAKLAAGNALNAISGEIETESLFEEAVERGWISADNS